MATTDIIPFAFYQRISPRERTLLLAVVGAVFLVANLLAVSAFFDAVGELRHDGAERAGDLEVQRLLASDRPKLEQRMNWLHAKQPALVSRDRAGTGLLDQIQQFARGTGVVVANPIIMPLSAPTGENRTASPYYQAVTVEVDTQSNWLGIKKFIQNVQQPENFLVFDLAELHSSDTDPAVIKGKFRISKWYAPAH